MNKNKRNPQDYSANFSSGTNNAETPQNIAKNATESNSAEQNSAAQSLPEQSLAAQNSAEQNAAEQNAAEQNSTKKNSANQNAASFSPISFDGYFNSDKGGLTVSVIEPPEEVLAKKPLKITLLSLFLKALTVKNRKEEDERVKSVLPVNTLALFVLIVITSVLLLIFFDLSDGKIFIPVVLCFCAFAIPLVFMTLHYELCPQKRVTPLQTFFSFAAGAVLFALIEVLNNRVLVRFVYEGVLDNVFVPLVWVIGELLIVFVIIKTFNVTDLSSCVMLAVCVGMGFCFTRGVYSLFSALFLQVEAMPQGGIKYVGYGILDDSELLKQSVKSMLAKIPLDCIFYPLMLSSWSVIIGNVAAPLVAYRGAKRDHPFSTYLLLVLVAALYMLCEFNASYIAFDVALKAFCGAVSLFIGLRRVDDCLYKEAVLGDYSAD